MRKLILLFFIIPFLGLSQEIKYDNDYKLTDYIIVDVKGSKNELYKKALDWVNKFYKNPEKVMTVNTENELIKINGACVDCLVMSVIGTKYTNTLRYIITLEFKNDKYKFEISSVTFENADDLKDGKSVMLKKNGKLKSTFKKYPEAIEKELNHIFNNLKEFTITKKEDW
jgi:hypothetical protein